MKNKSMKNGKIKEYYLLLSLKERKRDTNKKPLTIRINEDSIISKTENNIETMKTQPNSNITSPNIKDKENKSKEKMKNKYETYWKKETKYKSQSNDNKYEKSTITSNKFMTNLLNKICPKNKGSYFNVLFHKKKVSKKNTNKSFKSKFNLSKKKIKNVFSLKLKFKNINKSVNKYHSSSNEYKHFHALTFEEQTKNYTENKSIRNIQNQRININLPYSSYLTLSPTIDFNESERKDLKTFTTFRTPSKCSSRSSKIRKKDLTIQTHFNISNLFNSPSIFSYSNKYCDAPSLCNLNCFNTIQTE